MSFPERYGSLRVVLSFSVFMNGLFTVSWASDRISLVPDYSIRDRINVGLDIHYQALEIAACRDVSGSPYICFQPPRASFPTSELPLGPASDMGLKSRAHSVQSCSYLQARNPMKCQIVMWQVKVVI